MEWKKVYGKADIYLGRGAGRLLQKDMQQAQSDIWIVSPYLSGELLEGLIFHCQRGVRVHIVTAETENLEPIARNPKIIIPSPVSYPPGEEAQKKLISNAKIKRIIGFILIFLPILLLFLGLLLFRPILLNAVFIKLGIVGFGLAVVAGGLLLSSGKTDLINARRLPTYYFHYTSPFDFYVARRDVFPHLKLYLIDDKIAYVGSFNYTKSGVNSNIESSCRLIDKNAVVGIKTYVSEILKTPTWLSVQQVGQQYNLGAGWRFTR